MTFKALENFCSCQKLLFPRLCVAEGTNTHPPRGAGQYIKGQASRHDPPRLSASLIDYAETGLAYGIELLCNLLIEIILELELKEVWMSTCVLTCIRHLSPSTFQASFFIRNEFAYVYPTYRSMKSTSLENLALPTMI